MITLQALVAGEDVAWHAEAGYMPDMTRAMQRMQTVSFAAGMASGGEPSFLAALQELERAGRSMSVIDR